MRRTYPKECKELLFYDLDQRTEKEAMNLKMAFDKFQTSYIIYFTKNGIHALGLTPLEPIQRGAYFQCLKDNFREFYGGQILRITPKENEIRKLYAYSFNFSVIQSLLSKYQKILNIPADEIPKSNFSDYSVNLIRYWSNG